MKPKKKITFLIAKRHVYEYILANIEEDAQQYPSIKDLANLKDVVIDWLVQLNQLQKATTLDDIMKLWTSSLGWEEEDVLENWDDLGV